MATLCTYSFLMVICEKTLFIASLIIEYLNDELFLKNIRISILKNQFACYADFLFLVEVTVLLFS